MHGKTNLLKMLLFFHITDVSKIYAKYKKKISTIKLTINDYISKGVSKLRVYEL